MVVVLGVKAVDANADVVIVGTGDGGASVVTQPVVDPHILVVGLGDNTEAPAAVVGVVDCVRVVVD